MPNIDNKGWGFPTLSKKAHFFNSGEAISLCGKWMFTGVRIDEWHEHPENCATCMKKRKKQEGEK